MPVTKLLFSLKNVSYLIDGKEILSSLTLDIHAGEYIGIIGPNGGGKTTLLRLLLGLLKPSSGSIDKKVSPMKIGYVPQRSSGGDVNFPATVEEIIGSGILESISSTERKTRINDAMKLTGISKLSSQRIGTLSGGERQRMMIARALAGNPEILFLDEPTSAIDPGSQEDLYAFIRKLHKKGLTIMMVSHDTDAIAHEVERVLCLNRHLVCHGAPEDTIHRFEHYGH